MYNRLDLYFKRSMNLRPALAFAILFACVGAASAQSPTKETYNAKTMPLDELSRELLTDTGYVLREDGKVWDKIADEAVRRDEMSYLLARLAGARRLKALLELNSIINRYENVRRITPADREAVRKIVSQHWPVFGVGTRREFRSYFSPEELESLNKNPPRFDRGSALLMRDPEPVTAAAMIEAAAAAPPAPASPSLARPGAPAVAAQPTAAEPEPAGNYPVYPRAVLTPFLEPLSLRRPSPFAPRRATAVAAAVPAVIAPAAVMPPAAVAPTAAVVAPAAAPVVAAPAPVAPAPPPPAAPKATVPPAVVAPPAVKIPAVPAPPLADSSLGVLKPWTPPAAPGSTPTVSAIATPPPSTTPPIVSAPPVPADTTQEEFDAFVANGPYSREGLVLLKMLAAKAPEFCRAILRRTVVRGTPLIVFDAARTGADRRAGFAPTPAGSPPTIALSPGALLIERKSGLFSRSLIALPEDPRAWAELAVAPPALEASRKDAVSSGHEAGAWGDVKLYKDNSRRGAYSTQQQAGELLERLLIIGLEREGYASSTYAARMWARSARLLFSARLVEDYGNSAFLDPDRRLELRDWIERGDEADDLLVAAWSSSRGNVLDPRRGGPGSQALYERQARADCARSLLADHLAEAARSLAARARTIEALNDSGLLSNDVARGAASKAEAEESAARKALLASPPACDGRFGAEEAGLRRSSALLGEVSRVERAFREQTAKGQKHARD